MGCKHWIFACFFTLGCLSPNYAREPVPQSFAEMLVVERLKISTRTFKSCIYLSLTFPRFLFCSEEPVCISNLHFFFPFTEKKKRPQSTFWSHYLNINLHQNKQSHFGRIFFYCLCLILDLSFPAISVTHHSTFLVMPVLSRRTTASHRAWMSNMTFGVFLIN